MGPRAEPVLDNRVHEQTAIAGQDCSILGGHDLEKATVLPPRLVSAIYSKEAKIPGQSAEMSIDDEAFATPPLQARLQRKNVLGRRESIDVNPRGSLDLTAEINGDSGREIGTADSDQINLRVRNPACLNYILNRCLFG